MTAVTHTPTGRPPSVDDARALTDAIRMDAQALWMQLLRAFEGNAHGALGYTSWTSYCAAEFDLSKTRACRLLQAAQVVEVAEPELPIGNSVVRNEAVAREFVQLLDRPDELRSAHAEVVKMAPRDAAGKPKVTARQVKAVVERRAQSVMRTEHPVGSGVPEMCVPHVGIDIAVSTLRSALSSSMDGRARKVSEAVGLLRKAAQGHRGWKRSQAPAKAFRDLVEILAGLLEGGGHGE